MSLVNSRVNHGVSSEFKVWLIYIYINVYIYTYMFTTRNHWMIVNRYCKVNSLRPSDTYICQWHYTDVIMGPMASQITSVSSVYSTVCSDADKRKHQSSVSLDFVRVIHWWLVNSPHKGQQRGKCFYFMTSSWNLPSSVQKMAFHLVSAKPLSEPMLEYC